MKKFLTPLFESIRKESGATSMGGIYGFMLAFTFVISPLHYGLSTNTVAVLYGTATFIASLACLKLLDYRYNAVAYFTIFYSTSTFMAVILTGEFMRAGYAMLFSLGCISSAILLHCLVAGFIKLTRLAGHLIIKAFALFKALVARLRKTSKSPLP